MFIYTAKIDINICLQFYWILHQGCHLSSDSITDAY